MPNKYLDSVGLAEYTGLVKDYVDTKADDYLPLAGGTLTGNVYTTPYYDSTIVDPEGGQTLVVCKGKVAKGTAPSNNEYHTMAMAVDNSGSTNNAYKYGQVETDVKTDGSVETIVQAYKNEANSTTSAKISVGYDANGNAFTSAPTPTAGDNSTKIATTAFVNTKAGNYLPLAGGTMTGNIKSGSNELFVLRKENTSYGIQLWSGTAYNNGASISLYGKDFSQPGVFNLGAYNGTQYSILHGEPNGTLTWGGNNVITAAGGTMTGPFIKNGIIARGSDDSGTVNVYGGTGYDGGATVVLSGKSASSNAGQFNIGAYDGTNRKILSGKPDGTLTWDGISITDGTFLTTRNVTINVTSTGTGVRVGTATAPAVSKYRFVCWTYCVSSGGVFPAYPSAPQNSTSDIWAINPNSNSKVICHALYVRKW